MAKKQKKAKKVVKKSAPKAQVQAPRRSNEIGITLLGDRVLIQPKEVEVTTASGIIIPDTVKKEKMMTGLVVAAGPGRYGDAGNHIPMAVQVGDTVYFSRGWDEESNKFSWKGEDYFLVTENEIKAIIQ